MANTLGFKVTCNKANAEIYIINMIVGSYFLPNEKVDKRLASKRIDYSLLKKEKQIDWEDEIIKKMESLGEAVLNRLCSLKYYLQILSEDEKTVAHFRTGFEEIICKIDENGRLTSFKLVEGAA